MKLPFYHIDAFTGRVFAGNPAGVALLEKPLPDEALLAIAAENNLSETAFLLRDKGVNDLRWFTPTVEVDLCGHGTLATAFVVFERGEAAGDLVEFMTKSGPVAVRRVGELYELDFPARPAEPRAALPELAAALGAEPAELHASRDLLAVFDTEAVVRGLAPDFAKLAAVETFAVIVTAPGDGVDFVSRVFAPRAGIDEDPVTGSTHCTLTPYWAQRLRKPRLTARQVSARGGELFLESRGDRVGIAGRAVSYLQGNIEVPG
ncbi:MAG: PhzF family phenazine biosynthesis protein [Candidatus Krumholzibacteriota bacterium]|nr:PhzF family phenazine biosynthesis protein [Candidatus Krumholzibacteriota bacterium]